MKVAVIGAGGMGAVHARVHTQLKTSGLGVDEVLIADRDETRAQALAQRFGARAVVDLETALTEADAIDLCVPTDVHAALIHQVLPAGKPILCEKPLARTLEESRGIVDAVQACGVPFMTAQVVRYFPDFRRLHDLVLAGSVGTPAAVRTHRGGAAPKGDGLWFTDFSRSGGVLLDVAVHDFDWLLWTFGPVAELSARSRAVATGEGADYALTTLKFESGAVAHVEATWLDPSGFRTAVEVAGSEGLLQYDSRQSASLKVTTEGRVAHEMNVVPEEDPYYLQSKAFVTAVNAGEHPPVTVLDGFNAVAVAFAALESAATGKKVKPEYLS